MTVARARWFAPTPVREIGGYGRWAPFTWSRDDGNLRHGVVLVPKVAPWRGLFAQLDAEGSGLSDAPVTLLEEAHAIAATCWRYGSYAHALSFGERFAPFAKDRTLSRINDSEMMRINVETSAALAAWLADREQDPARVNRRVRAASAILPMPWRETDDATRDWVEDASRRRARELTAFVMDALRTADVPREAAVGGSLADPAIRRRFIANWLVTTAYRNGPVEDFHAGYWSAGDQVPGYRRFAPAELAKLAGAMVRRIPTLLAFTSTAPAEVVLFAAHVQQPSAWTVTEETAICAFPGVPGGEPLTGRVSELAARYPHAYSPGLVDGTYDMYYGRFSPGVGVLVASGVLLDQTMYWHRMRR